MEDSESGSCGSSSDNPSSEHISLPNDDSISIIEQLKIHCKPTYRIRRVRNKGAILILIWNFLAISILWYVGNSNCRGNSGIPDDNQLTTTRAFLGLTLPLAGWLADACIGRYRMIYCSVLIMWVAAILELVSSIADSLLTGYYFTNTVVTQILMTIMFIGLGGFLSTIVQFGIDQLHDASTEEISAYIMWYVWTCTFPFLIMMISCSYLVLNHQHFVLLGNLFICLNLSLVLVSLFCWNNLFIKEPISQNPFKLIYKVSKYALKHRYWTSRSAFTYAEEEAIDRIDFGKSKYGGPFTTEQVEDVKTFYRLLPVVICCGIITSGMLATGVLEFYLSAQFVIPLSMRLNTISYINYHIAASIIPHSEPLLIMLYEIFIYPIFQRCCPWVTSLHKFIIGAILQTVTLLAYMVFEILTRKSYLEENGYNATVLCTFYHDQRLATKFNYNWIAIPQALLTLSRLMMVIGFLEFFCAQVPYSMKGVILGVSFCSVIATASLCTVLRIPFQQRLSIWGTGVISCGFWYVLLYIILSIFGCIVGALIINWYKKRKREDVLPNEHFFAERYYTNLLEHRAA